jgi:hypothetical protein
VTIGRFKKKKKKKTLKDFDGIENFILETWMGFDGNLFMKVGFCNYEHNMAHITNCDSKQINKQKTNEQPLISQVLKEIHSLKSENGGNTDFWIYYRWDQVP